MRTPARWLLALLSLAIAVLGIAGAAGASVDDESGGQVAVPGTLPTVTEVDATSSDVKAMIMALNYDLDAEAIAVVEGGQDIAVDSVTSARSVSRDTEIVFVVDVDNRSLRNDLLVDANRALIDRVESFPGELSFGLISAGERAVVQTRLTDQVSTLTDDLLSLRAEQGAALFDAIDLAGQAFSDEPDVVRTVVVLAAGPDTASTLTAASATPSVVQSGAQMVVVDAGVGDESLGPILAKVGGGTLALDDPEQVEAVVDRAVAVAADRLLVGFEGLAASGERGAVTLTFGGETLEFSYPAGVKTSGLLRLGPEAPVGEGGGLFGRPIILYISLALAFVGISLAVWSLGSIYFGGESLLDKRLARYSDGATDLDDDEVQEMLVQSALLQRAVDLTENFAERQGFLARVEAMLERANLPIRAGEALFFAAGIITLVFAGVFFGTGNVFAALVLAIVTAALSFFAVQFAASRRLKQFEAQLPDTLQLLAGTLRAGYSLPQGLDAVSDEIADPMGYELRRAMTEAQLGRELEESLTGIAERLDSPDFAWAVMAIGIQREVGGNLNELLMTVSDTMVQRERLRREVNALTAEGRVSAGILSMMPPGLGLVMYVMNPDYIGVLFSRTIGLVLIGLAFVSGLVGLLWMKKVITIDA